ncbi:MAG: YdcF family protein [Oscillospiraceae bacterium]|nr:YdcF family protein [Oscillospiraceae bacterium]
MHDLIKEIGDFIFVEDEPQKCNVIITVGGSFPQIAEKAAELYKNGFSEYVLAGGGVSVKTGVFAGVKDKKEIYSGDYKTECDFYEDVLIKNGVPQEKIVREDKSGHTRANAECAAAVLKEHGIPTEKIILVCKRFHARRCLMFFRSYFPETEILVVPADIDVGEMNVTKDNWHTYSYGIKRVMGELARCGDQFTETDINNYKAGKPPRAVSPPQ